MTRLIDADDMIKSLMDMTFYDEEGYTIDDYEERLAIVKSFVDPVQTVDAEPIRHGRFIGTEYDGYADGNPVYYEWKCSECGCVFEDEEPTYNYCPNCGADMKGENNE